MAGSLPARLTPREGRKFAFTVGLAFLILGAIVLWRGKDTVAAVLAGLGGLLVVAGILAPAHLGPVQRAWMGLAHALSKITTPIVMGVIYFIVIAPFGLIRRAVGKNALVRRLGEPDLAPGGYWVVREPERRRSDLNRQY